MWIKPGMFDTLPEDQTYRVFSLDLAEYPRQEFPVQVSFWGDGELGAALAICSGCARPRMQMCCSGKLEYLGPQFCQFHQTQNETPTRVDDVAELDWLTRLVLFKIEQGPNTSSKLFEKHVKPKRVRLENESGQVGCTLNIDMLAWSTAFARFEIRRLFTDVRSPFEKVHDSGCLHSRDPDMVIQNVHTRSLAEAFYFRLCSRAIMKIGDIARNRLDRLRISDDGTRNLDPGTRLILEIQARTSKTLGSAPDLVDVAFDYNASTEDLGLKRSFRVLWDMGHDPHYYEAGDKGYQDRTWRARSWYLGSEDGDSSAERAI